MKLGKTLYDGKIEDIKYQFDQGQEGALKQQGLVLIKNDKFNL